MIELLPLPIIWLVFYIIGRILDGKTLVIRCYIVTLASMSLLLFGCGLRTGVFYVVVASAIIFLASILSRVQNSRLNKVVFITSIAASVLMIIVFLKWRIYFQKYFVYLPSLSYLGFRGIAYLASAYRRKNIHFSMGLMQMFFFPMLFIGPISRVENFEKIIYDYPNVLKRLMLGLSMLIAGHFCAGYVLTISVQSAVEIHWLRYWLGAVANSFELYFTFAGYSHLIIGLGLLVGFKLPENFNNPYLATSISEFWRRWHMSLSYWLRDYLYIPLGGNRKGIVRKCFNLMVPMGICGAWHGLSWHYVLWGFYHGLLLSIGSVMAHFGFCPLQRLFPTVFKPIKVVNTFCLVTFGWLLFTYPMPEFLVFMKGLVSW